MRPCVHVTHVQMTAIFFRSTGAYIAFHILVHRVLSRVYAVLGNYHCSGTNAPCTVVSHALCSAVHSAILYSNAIIMCACEYSIRTKTSFAYGQSRKMFIKIKLNKSVCNNNTCHVDACIVPKRHIAIAYIRVQWHCERELEKAAKKRKTLDKIKFGRRKRNEKKKSSNWGIKKSKCERSGRSEAEQCEFGECRGRSWRPHTNCCCPSLSLSFSLSCI